MAVSKASPENKPTLTIPGLVSVQETKLLQEPTTTVTIGEEPSMHACRTTAD